MTLTKILVTPEGSVEVPLTSEEIAQYEQDQADFEQSLNNRTVRAQIASLEALQTPRRIRDAISGKDGGWLENLETQISNLRSQLN